MSELTHFPMLSQRDSNPNADYDCVPASIAACLEYLTGKKFTASQVKDAAYPHAYVGGTAAIQYVQYCAQQGVKLSAMDGNGAQLVVDLHAQLAAGHPCLITEPDPYAPGWTHVCAAYKDDANSITVMDPWIASPVTKSNAEWAEQLRFNEIWTLEREETDMMTITDPFAAAHFKQTASNPDRWHCAETNQDLFAGILGGWRRMNGAPRLPKSGEVKCGKTAVYQECEGGIVVYDPDHELDNPGGPWAPCYLLHLDSPLAKQLFASASSPNTADALAQIQTAEAALNKAESDLKS